MSAMGITQHTRFQHAGQAVPDATPLARLCVLLDRYQSATDPAVRVLPPAYRQAVVERLRHLLASRVPEGAAA